MHTVEVISCSEQRLSVFPGKLVGGSEVLRNEAGYAQSLASNHWDSAQVMEMFTSWKSGTRLIAFQPLPSAVLSALRDISYVSSA